MNDDDAQIAWKILALAISLSGIYLAFRRSKKPSITLFRQTSADLFTKNENLDGLEITYHGVKIIGNIVLFNAIFLNDGNTDINRSKVFEPIELVLPEEFSWLEFSIPTASPGFNVNLNYELGKIKFKWDLFKEGEYFTFKSIILFTPKSSNKIKFPATELFSEIKINHRIEDLKEISKQWNVSKPKPLIDLILSIVGHLLLLILGFIFSFDQFNHKKLSEFTLGNYLTFLLGIIMIIGYSVNFFQYYEGYRKNKFYKNIQQ